MNLANYSSDFEKYQNIAFFLLEKKTDVHRFQMLDLRADAWGEPEAF